MNSPAPLLAILGLCLGGCLTASAARRPNWRALLARPEAWCQSAEGIRQADNILSFQTDRGDWPKNMDTVSEPFAGDRSRLPGTFDNSATVNEVRFLARAHLATRDKRYLAAVEKALLHILEAQYANGGWPQSSPPGRGYSRYITFNDGTMVNLLELLQDVGRRPEFDAVDPVLRGRAAEAVRRGIDCLLQCQVRVDGRLTVWCAQHDDLTLEPRPARTFEPVSLSGGESAGILRFLMQLDHPSPAVVAAVRAGVEWYDQARLTGLRMVDRDGDRVVVEDSEAPALWARFYEIGTNRPLFSGRDGVVRSRLADIEKERRTGYAWYGTWGDSVLAAYRRWAAQ